MVGLDRLELSTSPLSGVRSNHLSYRPEPGAVFRLSVSRTSGKDIGAKLRKPKRASAGQAAPSGASPKGVRREDRQKDHQTKRRKRNEDGTASGASLYERDLF